MASARTSWIGYALAAAFAQTDPAGGGLSDAGAETEARLARERAAPRCRFRKGAWPSQTLGEDVTGVRVDARRWLRPSEIPIKKIVVLMQENRSFDHYFGRLPEYLRRHFPDHPGARPGGIDVPPPGASNPVDVSRPKGRKVPWQPAKKLCHSDTNHEWWGSHFQWNGGRMNGFYQSNNGFFEKNEPKVSSAQLDGTRAMEYYDERHLPFYYKLAATFAIGDRYFSSVIGPTWPNRDFLYGATSRGLTYNAPVETKEDLARDLRRDPAIILDQLSAARIPWRIYIDGDWLTSHVARVGAFTGPLGLARRLFPKVEARVRNFYEGLKAFPARLERWAKTLWERVRKLDFKGAYDFLKARMAVAWTWANRLVRSAAGTLRKNVHLWRIVTALKTLMAKWDGWKIVSLEALSGAKAVWAALDEVRRAVGAAILAGDAVLRGPTARIARFFEDARKGQLPKVSFIDSNVREDVNSTDEHPPADVQIGQRFTWRVVQALMRSPDWPHTVLFITYDEHGGFYDHVPPPLACPPDETTGDPDRYTSVHPGKGGVKFTGALDVKFRGAFNRYGIRVPLIVVSPWVKRSYVSHKVYDHTSILRFIQARLNLPALSNRDANADAMFDFFDFRNYRWPARAPSAGIRPTEFPMPPIDEAELARCRRIFPPARITMDPRSILRKVMPSSIAADPYPEGSHHLDFKKVEPLCSRLEPGVCDWRRALRGPLPEPRPHHALPVLGGE